MTNFTPVHWCLFAILAISTIACGKESPAPAKTSVAASIRNFSKDWIGTPYKLGGTSREGIDCSALTQKLFDDVFHVVLPRRVVEQRVEGLEIHRDSLEAGDLIVFRGTLFGRPHIGVYINKGDFLHASSSKGVTISNLDEYYWKKKFRCGRRIIDKRGRLIVSAD
jgi:murein DD-endopeptidase / murein LD-carboxypeptidase